MKCNEVENELDDYLDLSCAPHGTSGLDDQTAAAISLHLQDCAQCEAELERRHGLLNDLRSLPAPQPDAGLFEKTLGNAVEAATSDSARNEQQASANRRRTDSRRTYSTAVNGLAAAAMIALVLGTFAFGPRTDDMTPVSGLPSISLATDTVTPVKLAFSTEKALADARLSLSLPVGVELVGYNGRSDISWTTDLEEGTNVLRLPLVGRTAADDLLIARLEHPTGTKTFRLQVTVNESGAP